MTGPTLFAPGTPGEPIELVLVQDHPYRRKGRDADTGRKRIGCATCNRAMYHRNHLGAPPSLNEHVDREQRARMKAAWQAVFLELLKASPLEPCTMLNVEGQVSFRDRRERDEGNLRWMVEKALGDALVEGRYLPSDSFYPERRYSFGNLEGVHTPGQTSLRLLLFPIYDVA